MWPRSLATRVRPRLAAAPCPTFVWFPESIINAGSWLIGSAICKFPVTRQFNRAAAAAAVSIGIAFRTFVGYRPSRFFQPCRQQLEIEKLLDVRRRCGHGLHVTRTATEANLKT